MGRDSHLRFDRGRHSRLRKEPRLFVLDRLGVPCAADGVCPCRSPPASGPAPAPSELRGGIPGRVTLKRRLPRCSTPPFSTEPPPPPPVARPAADTASTTPNRSRLHGRSVSTPRHPHAHRRRRS